MHNLVDLYQVCSNCAPGAKIDPSLGVTCFTQAYIGKNMEKIFLSETIRPRALIFGMQHDLVDLYQVCSNYTPLGPKLTPPQVSPGTWPAFNRYLYVSLKKTQGSNLGPLGPLVTVICERSSLLWTPTVLLVNNVRK